MDKIFRGRGGIVCLLLLFILVGWMSFAYPAESEDKREPQAVAPSSSSKDSQPNQKGDQPSPEQAYKLAIQTLTHEIFQHTKKIETSIYILTILVAIITLLVIIIQIVYGIRSQKALEEWKKNFENEWARGKWEAQLSKTIDEVHNIAKKTSDTIQFQVDKIAHEAKLLAEGQISSFEKVLLEQIEIKREPIEKRLLVAEEVRFSLWGKVAEKMLQAGDNIKTFITFWHLYQKAQLAISQMLSKEAADIFTGVNTFIDLSSERILPGNLNLLLTTLEEQKRIPLNVLPQIERLRNILAT